MARLYHAAIAEAELGYHVSYNAPTILIYILVHPGDYNNKVDIFRFIYIYIRRMVYKLESAESQIIQLDWDITKLLSLGVDENFLRTSNLTLQEAKDLVK